MLTFSPVTYIQARTWHIHLKIELMFERDDFHVVGNYSSLLEIFTHYQVTFLALAFFFFLKNRTLSTQFVTGHSWHIFRPLGRLTLVGLCRCYLGHIVRGLI